ncbi:MAG: 5-deoxy-glucuronate isomerase, partial [Pseudoflavonifractor sp.]
MISNPENLARMRAWDITSPETEGMHACIVPGAQDCKSVHIYRLNLSAGNSYTLKSETLEMNPVLICGRARVTCNAFEETMQARDSFYIPGKSTVELEAEEDAVFYIGAAEDEGYGAPFFRRFDPTLPLGNIHQIHGHGVGEREVFFTLNPEVPASRLLCGLTWGGNGSWTSWPPHQHEKDLEEAYCYFDMDAPKFGLHLSYLKSGETEDVVAHTVRSGSMILAPV